MRVVKVGGALIDSAVAREQLLRALKPVIAQAPLLLVHGGGIQATELAQRMGHSPRMVHGRRVTTELDLDVHLWVTTGELNTRLAAAAHAVGVRAIALDGASAGMIQVVRRPPRQVDGETIDFGWVGDIERVDTGALTVLLNAGQMPIVAPLGVDRAGQLYNVNADSIAARIAHALNADELCFLTESGGLNRGPELGAERIAHVDRALFDEGRRAGWIQGGMLAKLENAFAALSDGVKQVRICAVDEVANAVAGTRVSASY
jgi:acetylglutamate kinase